MIIFQIICLIFSLFVLQTYISKGIHAKSHRLLPVVQVVICVYYFYEILSKKGKNGYIKVEQDRKNKDSLYVQMFYNYAKIESYVPKTKIENVLANSIIILNSKFIIRSKEPCIFY